MKNRRLISIIIYVVILVLICSWITGLLGDSRNALRYSEILNLFQTEQVRSFTATQDSISLELYKPLNGSNRVTCANIDTEALHRDLEELLTEQTESGVLVSFDFGAKQSFDPYDLILPMLLVGGVLLLVWFILMSRISGTASGGNPLNNFGKARTTMGVLDGQKVTFADVAGADEEKAELQEVVDFLKDPNKFTQLGAKIPHGILLVGPPGTGKTLLARAVAGEANVQFLSISGSDFVEMYVGVGASRVRDLFAQAKQVAPAIVFIDEIDAVGRKRGSGLGGGHDEKEQTLNQLLVEMDGFGKNEGVIVLAATNRPDILDPALQRPGRFDRKVYVGAPDIKGREEVLKVHSRNKRLADSVDLHTVALATIGFTGADLANLMNEAAIRAARLNHPVIDMDDLNESMMKIIAGPEKHSRVRHTKDLHATAVHEAGHAVAMYYLPTHDPVRQISIIPRGQALGVTWSLPKEDTDHLTRNMMFEQIVGLLGGRVAEALFLQDISTGASNDIDRASKLARDMVARYGMCEKLGTVSYTNGDEVFIGRDYEKTKSYSEKVAGTIDDEVKELMDRAYDKCSEILKTHEQALRAVVDFLLKHETMSGQQFAACMEGKAIELGGKSSLFDGFTEE